MAFCQIDADVREICYQKGRLQNHSSLLKKQSKQCSATMFLSLVPLLPVFCHGYNTKPAVTFFCICVVIGRAILCSSLAVAMKHLLPLYNSRFVMIRFLELICFLTIVQSP